MNRLTTTTQLSPGTFGNFAREFSSFVPKDRRPESTVDRRQVLRPSTQLIRMFRTVLSRRNGFAARGARASNDHAAASVDGQDRKLPIGSPPRGRSGRRLRAPSGLMERVARAEVHLVRRLAAKCRMWKHLVVFPDVELDRPPDCNDAI
jgi:hypothetical protein